MDGDPYHSAAINSILAQSSIERNFAWPKPKRPTFDNPYTSGDWIQAKRGKHAGKWFFRPYVQSMGGGGGD